MLTNKKPRLSEGDHRNLAVRLKSMISDAMILQNTIEDAYPLRHKVTMAAGNAGRAIGKLNAELDATWSYPGKSPYYEKRK